MNATLLFKNDRNPIAILLNAFWLLGAVGGLAERTIAGALPDCLLLIPVIYLLLANFIRLTRKAIEVRLYSDKITLKSMFGWRRTLKIDCPAKDHFHVVQRYHPFNRTRLESTRSLFIDGIRALFHLRRENNLFYKNRLICSGVVR